MFGSNTGDSRAIDFGPGDYLFAGAGTYGPFNKVALWHILTSLSFINDEFCTCKEIYSHTLCCFVFTFIGQQGFAINVAALS